MVINLEKMGLFICEKRKENNLTQNDLANLTFVTPQAVSKWENGLSAPDITTIPYLVKSLNITVDMLFNSSFENNENNVIKEFVVASINKEYKQIAESIKEDSSKIDILLDIKNILENESMEKVFDQIELDKLNMDDIIKIAPFFNNEQLDKIVQTYENESIFTRLAPFLEQEHLKTIIQKNCSNSLIVKLAPFIEEDLYQFIIDNIETKSYPEELFISLAPFLEQEHLIKIKDEYKSESLNVALTPFVE